MRRRTLLAALPLFGLAARAHAAEQGLTVFAAASLTEALNDNGALWAAQGHPAPRFSYAASSTLARQLEQGAPANLFASADTQWMDWAETRHLIVPETRRNLLGNTLVLIAPKETARPVAIPGTDFAALLGPEGRLATGDPAAVPVGIYAQEALTKLGQWDKVAPRLARAESVRAALMLVSRGEAPYGIVYATDAAAAPGVAVVGHFPADLHSPIVYPFAVTRTGDTPEARAFLDFLSTPAAASVFRKRGFVVQS
jgi:molybdate transport system substrate-binding protein